MNRVELANRILKRLEPMKQQLKTDFSISKRINTFCLDDLLEEDLALRFYNSFPEPDQMMQKKSLKEFKNVAAQMDKYNPLLEEIVYAFQDERIVQIIGEITGLKELIPDDRLYAGGISLMSKDNFLNPHLDNSHDNVRTNYRVLNLLYYVTPDWKQEFGGNLELWDNGVKLPQRTIVSKFNRLVVMVTNQSSFHSVSKVLVNKNRCCISNYYFSQIPAENKHYFHVTSFYGRPEEKIKNLLLEADAMARNFIRTIFKKGVLRTKHIYNKNK